MSTADGVRQAPEPFPVIDEPGVYDVTAAEYHADPVAGGSLSSTGLRSLLPPSCPAKFAYERKHGRPDTATFDFGHAAHRYVLGAGADLAVVHADDWRTKRARDERDDARAAGLTPILVADDERARAMAQAVREHPLAGRLFTAGQPEQALVWQDPSGVWMRALLDWLPNRVAGRRLLVADYKTIVSADLEACSKALSRYWYAQQAAHYLAGVDALGLAPDGAAFLFVFQEKTPPYLVTVTTPDAVALRVGQARNREALDIYRACVAAGRWPGYSDDVEVVSLPPWIEKSYALELQP
jgi:hypothetical protein